MSEYFRQINIIQIKNKYSNNYNDIGKDDTIQVLQPYFHSGPYIYSHKALKGQKQHRQHNQTHMTQ